MSEYSVEGEWNNFIIKYIKPEDHPKLFELIRVHLIPCMSIVGYNESEFDDWKTIFEGLLADKHELHFMAVDKESGEIAGFRIIGTHKTGEPEHMPEFKHKRTTHIMQAMIDMGVECRVDDHTNVEYYADFFGMCVLPKYRQRGLCTELYKRALELSKSRGFTIAKVSFASPFSRKAGFTNGFKRLGKRYCIDFKDENGTPLKADVDPQWYIDMGIFEL